ncbi:MAG: glycosyltransferase [Chthoniobacterales bacterium]
MNIFLSCLQSPHRYPIPSYDFWTPYFRNGLHEAGHTILEDDRIDWAKGLMPLPQDELLKWKSDTWSQTIDLLKKESVTRRVDLFLSYLYPQQVDASAIATIQAMGVPCVNFFCDNVREYRRIPDAFHPFDLHWVPEFKALPLYEVRKWKTVYAPMPCWIPPERRVPIRQERPIVSFIGGRDSLRAGVLARAAASDLPFEVRGPSWLPSVGNKQLSAPPPASADVRLSAWLSFIEHQGIVAAGRRLFSRFQKSDPPVDFSKNVRPMPEQDDYQSIVAESAVSLGINRYPSFRFPLDKPDTYSRLRDIEAPMLGACYLTEWTAGLDRLYDLETEISTYRSGEELVEKAKSLLADDKRRASMREKAQKRALTEHSVGHTVEKISQTLGLKNSSS